MPLCRDKFLEALVEKYNVKPPQASSLIKIGAPLTEDEAILMLQRNERGAAALLLSVGHGWARACMAP